MALSRRHFLGLTGTAAVTAAVGGAVAFSGSDGPTAAPLSNPTPATPTRAPTPTPTPDAGTAALVPVEDRVLVVVQMSGGNDGLNTLVPVVNGAYHDARPTLALAEDDVVPLEGLTEMALHPALAPLVRLWDAGQLAALQAVGLPDQSRSHFVALDTWWAGGDVAAPGGWLGRWLDATAAEDPDPMRAIALGGGSPALTGVQTRPVIVQTPQAFDLIGPSRSAAAADAFAAMGRADEGGLLGQAQGAIPVAVGAVDDLQGAFSQGTDPALGARNGAGLFAAAADVITADLGTKVILINLGGYDTHADQAARHDALLDELAVGLAGLFDRLAVAGMQDRVLAATFSEFGRRVAENGSGGTDHGKGGLAFLAGPALARSTVVGAVDLGRLDDGDVALDLDSRSLYANALNWLGGPTDDVLGGAFDTYDLLRT